MAAPVTPSGAILFPEPEGAIGAVDQVTTDLAQPEDNSVTEKPKDPVEMLDEELDMEEVTSLLQNMSYTDICGRRPWKNVKYRTKIYPKGHETKGGFSGEKPSSPTRGGRRRNSKYLWGNRTPKIVNGDIADYGEWPWQVSLRQWRTGKISLKRRACGMLQRYVIENFLMLFQPHQKCQPQARW